MFLGEGKRYNAKVSAYMKIHCQCQSIHTFQLTKYPDTESPPQMHIFAIRVCLGIYDWSRRNMFLSTHKLRQCWYFPRILGSHLVRLACRWRQCETYFFWVTIECISCLSFVSHLQVLPTTYYNGRGIVWAVYMQYVMHAQLLCLTTCN